MEESDRRYNQMVDLVNHNRPKSELVPPIQNKEEDEKFDMLVYELSNLRRKYPKAMLAHIDSEWGGQQTAVMIWIEFQIMPAIFT